MATVIPFERFAFGASEVGALQAALSHFSYPGGWCGWDGELGSNGECDELEVVNPNDWEPLTLIRTRRGGYLARDADELVIAEADTFSELLSALGIVPS